MRMVHRAQVHKARLTNRETTATREKHHPEPNVPFHIPLIIVGQIRRTSRLVMALAVTLALSLIVAAHAPPAAASTAPVAPSAAQLEQAEGSVDALLLLRDSVAYERAVSSGGTSPEVALTAALEALTPQEFAELLSSPVQRSADAETDAVLVSLAAIQSRDDYGQFVTQAQADFTALLEGTFDGLSSERTLLGVIAAGVAVAAAALGVAVACSAGLVSGPLACVVAAGFLVAAFLNLIDQLGQYNFERVGKTQYCAYQAMLYYNDPSFEQGQEATVAACSRVADPN